MELERPLSALSMSSDDTLSSVSMKSERSFNSISIDSETSFDSIYSAFKGTLDVPTPASSRRTSVSTDSKPSSTPAATAVLCTVELLELILSNLRMRDLLSAQRVSYLWSRIISTHKAILKTKYLLPDTSIPLYNSPATNWTTPTPFTNPLFIQRFVQSSALYALRRVNPQANFMGMDHSVRAHIDSLGEDTASWRRMLLFQPPVKKAWLRPMSARFEDPPRLLVAREGCEGLVMGDVVAAFEELVKGDTSGYFVHVLSCTVTRKVVWMLTPA